MNVCMHTLMIMHVSTHISTQTCSPTPVQNFSRCEPKWIPIQFIDCACNATSHGSCIPKGNCKFHVPIGSCRCICCYGPDPIDHNSTSNAEQSGPVDHNSDAEQSDPDDDATVMSCKDGVWKCVCCKGPVEEAKLCISSPEPPSLPNQETPLLESSSVKIQTGSTTYGTGKLKVQHNNIAIYCSRWSQNC